MKLALVFDDLIQYGGAERLLLTLHSLYPEAPIYTSLSSGQWVARCKENNITLHTSFMQKLPFRISANKLYGLLGIHALAFESFDFSSYDVVLSMSARFAHCIITGPKTKHVCYMNSPGRMFWEHQDYFEREGVSQPFLTRILTPFLVLPLLSIRRVFDYISAQRVDYFIANSSYVKSKITKYYNRDSEVIYPCYEMTSNKTINTESEEDVEHNKDRSDYFLIITRLNGWKRVDIAVKACTDLGVNLIVVGDGPDLGNLRKIAGNNVSFKGYVPESEKISLLNACKAFIVTQKEDFGISPIEAMSVGKPVIAYRAGGVEETVIEGVTGIFYNEQTPKSLTSALKYFNPARFIPEDSINRAKLYTKEILKERLDEFLKRVYDS